MTTSQQAFRVTLHVFRSTLIARGGEPFSVAFQKALVDALLGLEGDSAGEVALKRLRYMICHQIYSRFSESTLCLKERNQLTQKYEDVAIGTSAAFSNSSADGNDGGSVNIKAFAARITMPLMTTYEKIQLCEAATIQQPQTVLGLFMRLKFWAF